MLVITRGKGFALTFENGWTISVQFGSGNYHDRREMFPQEGFELIDEADRRIGAAGSPNAEIAIWDPDGTWFNFGTDTVKGFVSADDVAEWIVWTKRRLAEARLPVYSQDD